MRADILPASALGPSEWAAWRAMMAADPALRRAFLAPGFARAAGPLARVAVLHDGGRIAGFFAFQFASPWHRRAGLAERVGGALCDAAGLVAAPGLALSPRALLRLCRIGQLFVTHLIPGQEAHGLAADATEIGHLIDLSAGGAAFHATRPPDLHRDTARRLRRAERELGPLRFSFDATPGWAEVSRLIERKRAQYRRTAAEDPFARPGPLALLEALFDAPAPDCRPTLASLHAGDRLLAQHFGLQCGDVLSYWFPVYEPELEKLSPGRLLLWRLTGAAERIGVRLIDRGAGDSPAKRDFSSRLQALGIANWSAGGGRGLAARAFQAAAWRWG